jgi:hypothetical protein
MGATSGRTVCGWPATEVNPIAAVAWRSSRYPASRRPPWRRATADQRSRPLAQTIGFEHADDRQHDPHDADVARIVECLAEGGDDRHGAQPRCQSRRQRRRHDDEQRIEAEHEARDDDGDAQQYPHARGIRLAGRLCQKQSARIYGTIFIAFSHNAYCANQASLVVPLGCEAKPWPPPL